MQREIFDWFTFQKFPIQYVLYSVETKQASINKQLSNLLCIQVASYMHIIYNGYSNNRKILFKPKVFAGIHK